MKIIMTYDTRSRNLSCNRANLEKSWSDFLLSTSVERSPSSKGIMNPLGGLGFQMCSRALEKAGTFSFLYLYLSCDDYLRLNRCVDINI